MYNYLYMWNVKKLTEGGGGGGGGGEGGEEGGGEKILNCNTTKLLNELDDQDPLQAFLQLVCRGINFL